MAATAIAVVFAACGEGPSTSASGSFDDQETTTTAVATSVVTTTAAPGTSTTAPATTTTLPDIPTCPNLVTSDAERATREVFPQGALHDDAERLQAYGREHRDTYGGLRFVGGLGEPGRLEITFKTDVGERCADVRSLVTNVDAVDVVVGQWSINDKLAAAQVAAAMGASPAAPDWGPVSVSVPAFAESLARTLHEDYGDMFEITLGHWPYPPPDEPIDICRAVDTSVTPDHVVVTALGPGAPIDVTAPSSITVTIQNMGDEVIWISYGNRGIGLVQPGTDERRSMHAEYVTLEAHEAGIAPGGRVQFGVPIGLTPCTLDEGYLLPPGSYEIRGPVSIVIGKEHLLLGFEPIPIEVVAPPPVSLPPQEAPVNTAPPTP